MLPKVLQNGQMRITKPDLTAIRHSKLNDLILTSQLFSQIYAMLIAELISLRISTPQSSQYIITHGNIA